MAVWRLLAFVLLLASIEPVDTRASPKLDPIEVFDTVCLKTMADVSQASTAAESLGLNPGVANDADPEHMATVVESPWEDAKLERVVARWFDSPLTDGAMVSVIHGSVVAKKDSGRRIFLSNCEVAEMTKVALGKGFDVYLDGMHKIIGARIEAELIQDDRQETDWRVISWKWRDLAENEDVQHVAYFRYKPVGASLILHFGLRIYRETP